MTDSQDEKHQTASSEQIKLEYETPTQIENQPHPDPKYMWVAILLAIGMMLTFGFAGVGGDHTTIPLVKKFVLSLAWIITTLLVCLQGNYSKGGCLAMALLYFLFSGGNFIMLWLSK